MAEIMSLSPQKDNEKEEEIIMRPGDIDKLNSFSDILIKLFHQLELRTQEYVQSNSSNLHNIPQPSSSSQSTHKDHDFSQIEEYLKSLEDVHNLLNQHKKDIYNLTNDNQQTLINLNKFKQEQQKALLTLTSTLQNDFNQRLDKAIETILPPEIAFPQITMDTSSDELLRILTTRLQNLEMKVHQQNQYIDTLKHNFELFQQQNELSVNENQTKFEQLDFQTTTIQHGWNHKTSDSIEILTELLKKHQKEYKSFVTTQATNNTKRDEHLFAIQNQIKKLEKVSKQLSEDANQRITEVTISKTPLPLTLEDRPREDNKHSPPSSSNHHAANDNDPLLSPSPSPAAATIVKNSDAEMSTPSIAEVVPVESISRRGSKSSLILSSNDDSTTHQQPTHTHSTTNNESPRPSVVAHPQVVSETASHNHEDHHPQHTSSTSSSSSSHHTSSSSSKHKKSHKSKSSKKSSSKVPSSHHSSPASSAPHPDSSSHTHNNDKPQLHQVHSMSEDEDKHEDSHSHSHSLHEVSVNRDDNELESRVMSAEYEISRINETMEVILQGFKELGNRLSKSAIVRSTIMNPPSISMPLSISLHQMTRITEATKAEKEQPLLLPPPSAIVSQVVDADADNVDNDNPADKKSSRESLPSAPIISSSRATDETAKASSDVLVPSLSPVVLPSSAPADAVPVTVLSPSSISSPSTVINDHNHGTSQDNHAVDITSSSTPLPTPLSPPPTETSQSTSSRIVQSSKIDDLIPDNGVEKDNSPIISHEADQTMPGKQSLEVVPETPQDLNVDSINSTNKNDNAYNKDKNNNNEKNDNTHMLVEVEEEIHQIIDALVQIGNIGADILSKDSSSIHSHHEISRTPDSEWSEPNTARGERDLKRTRNLVTRNIKPPSSGQGSGQNTPPLHSHNSHQPHLHHHHGGESILKAIEEMKEMNCKQEEKYLELENKIKSIDDNQRQMKLQVMSLQEMTKGLKVSMNNNSHPAGGGGGGAPSQTGNKNLKKSYKVQGGKTGGEDPEIPPEWFAPLEELKNNFQELKTRFDEKTSFQPIGVGVGVGVCIGKEDLFHPHLHPHSHHQDSAPQSVSTQAITYQDDDNASRTSVGDLSLLTESLVDGHDHHESHLSTPVIHLHNPLGVDPNHPHHNHHQHNQHNSSSSRPSQHKSPQSAYCHDGQGDGDMTDDLSDIHYDPSLPTLNSSLMEQRISKLERLLIDQNIFPLPSSEIGNGNEMNENENEELKLQQKEFQHTDPTQHLLTDTQSSLQYLTNELKYLKLSELNVNGKMKNIEEEVVNKLKYLTDSLTLLSDEMSAIVPREEFHRLLTSLNKEIHGMKKSFVEKDWIGNKLQQKVDKVDLDRLIAGITSIIGDPLQSSVAATHKCLVCDKPVSMSTDGKSSSGYDKADDPHIPHSPIKRPGTVSGRVSSSSGGLNSSTNSLSSDLNLPLPPVILPGGVGNSDKKKIYKTSQNQFQRRIRSAAGGGLGGSYQIDTR